MRNKDLSKEEEAVNQYIEAMVFVEQVLLSNIDNIQKPQLPLGCNVFQKMQFSWSVVTSYVRSNEFIPGQEEVLFY